MITQTIDIPRSRRPRKILGVTKAWENAAQEDAVHPGYSADFLKLRGVLKTMPLERPLQGSPATDCPREPL